MSSKWLPQESRPLITYRNLNWILGGNSQHFFWRSFLLIDEEVTSCSSRNEGKGPPSPSLPGILEGLPPNQGRHPRPGRNKKSSKKAPEASNSFNHLVVITAIPRKGRDQGIVRSRSCDGPNIVRSRILRRDLDQDLHYVVRYIDPENLLWVVSNPFCSYLKWC